MFSSKKLTDYFQDSKQFFEENELTISQVSYDIRSLELLLKKYCLNFTYAQIVSSEVKIVQQSDGTNINMAHFFYEYVAWEQNEKEKKPSYRIFYKKYGRLTTPTVDEHLSNEIEYNHSIPPGSLLLDRRPLVETPVSVRLKLYPFLPTFLKKIASAFLEHKPTLNFAQFQHSINEFEKAIK
jgi:hypothetical protein